MIRRKCLLEAVLNMAEKRISFMERGDFKMDNMLKSFARGTGERDGAAL